MARSWDRTRAKAGSFRLLPASRTLFCVSYRTEKVKVSHRAVMCIQLSRFLPSFAFVLSECSRLTSRPESSASFDQPSLYDRFTSTRIITNLDLLAKVKRDFCPLKSLLLVGIKNRYSFRTCSSFVENFMDVLPIYLNVYYNLTRTYLTHVLFLFFSFKLAICFVPRLQKPSANSYEILYKGCSKHGATEIFSNFYYWIFTFL